MTALIVTVTLITPSFAFANASGLRGVSVTNISQPASSGQGRKTTRIGYTGSFSNTGLAALAVKCVTELAA